MEHLDSLGGLGLGGGGLEGLGRVRNLFNTLLSFWAQVSHRFVCIQIDGSFDALTQGGNPVELMQVDNRKAYMMIIYRKESMKWRLLLSYVCEGSLWEGNEEI